MNQPLAILALSLSLLIAVVKPMCLWLRLRFLRHLFDLGGVDGMKAGADALARSSRTDPVHDAREAPLTRPRR
ncbi:hypothetical protein [Saccharopolyspora sp. SCSIO 74807]|uniref:hypothetical protein n=1 Tax=Saccharopolyspora sp. SCSIO 74807 TaxID=3118084 RepID=UPI0030CF2DCE